ncbi:MAG: SPOR domain-containing protein [Caulobacteraceae bacterium]|nr:SPOR domain-containing protein [Caulobacteraceae bacterium]
MAALLLAWPRPSSAAEDWWTAQDGPDSAVAIDAASIHCAKGQCSVRERTASDQEHYRAYRCSDFQAASAGTDWRPVEPDSTEEALLVFTCRFQTATPDMVQTGQLSFDSRPFARAKPGRRPPPAAAATAPLRPGEPPNQRPNPPPTGAGPSRATVQLGAANSQEAARQAVAGLQRRQPSLMAGLTSRIEPATVNGRQVYRILVSGFVNQSASSFCAALRAAGSACFVR